MAYACKKLSGYFSSMHTRIAVFSVAISRRTDIIKKTGGIPVFLLTTLIFTSVKGLPAYPYRNYRSKPQLKAGMSTTLARYQANKLCTWVGDWGRD
jgi:hypothetical protein